MKHFGWSCMQSFSCKNHGNNMITLDIIKAKTGKSDEEIDEMIHLLKGGKMGVGGTTVF